MTVVQSENQSIQECIALNYSGLSGRLREAADYVIANPIDVATRSLRAVSSSAGLAPATFTRLSRSLGFDSYEAMRELCRSGIGHQPLSFSEKAGRLVMEQNSPKKSRFFHRHLAACIDNIDQMSQRLDVAQMEETVALLSKAEQVVLFGAYSSTGIVDYFAYLARYFAPNWRVAGRNGASLSSTLVGLGPQDVVIILTKAPFAKRGILAAQMAVDIGAQVVLITDSHTCPAIDFARHHFIVPSDSPQFFFFLCRVSCAN